MSVTDLALGESKMSNFNLGYVKGMARACTLLAVLDQILFYSRGNTSGIEEAFKNVLESARVITIRIQATTDRLDLAIQNAKLAQRGRIRRANNVVTWAGIVLDLKGHGMTDPSTLVRAWNEKTANKDSHINGQKRTALLALLSLHPEALDILFAIVAEHGWEHCPFTEDFLASPKFKKDWYFRGASKAWQYRTKVTPAAQLMLMENLQTHYRCMPQNARKKMSRADLEELMQVMSVATNLADEIQDIMPIKNDTIQKEFLDLVVCSDQT
eukprot:1848453-Pyramimonas_sp.AAC.1